MNRSKPLAYQMAGNHPGCTCENFAPYGRPAVGHMGYGLHGAPHTPPACRVGSWKYYGGGKYLKYMRSWNLPAVLGGWIWYGWSSAGKHGYEFMEMCLCVQTQETSFYVSHTFIQVPNTVYNIYEGQGDRMPYIFEGTRFVLITTSAFWLSLTEKQLEIVQSQVDLHTRKISEHMGPTLSRQKPKYETLAILRISLVPPLLTSKAHFYP